MTRLAGGSPSMWAGIVEDNAAPIHDALLACEERLRDVRHALARGDIASVRAFLDTGRAWFDGDPTMKPVIPQERA
jgi:prephenate dehydrogenase